MIGGSSQTDCERNIGGVIGDATEYQVPSLLRELIEIICDRNHVHKIADLGAVTPVTLNPRENPSLKTFSEITESGGAREEAEMEGKEVVVGAGRQEAQHQGLTRWPQEFESSFGHQVCQVLDVDERAGLQVTIDALEYLGLRWSVQAAEAGAAN